MEEAISVAIRLNHYDCNLIRSRQAERLDAVERIAVEWLAENREYLEERDRHAVKEKYDREQYLIALERDGSRCVVCRHSYVNSGGVEQHHIIPRGCFGPERTLLPNIDHHSNRATLCSRCHGAITNPHDHDASHWRAVAPRLFALIGESDLADVFIAMQ